MCKVCNGRQTITCMPGNAYSATTWNTYSDIAEHFKNAAWSMLSLHIPNFSPFDFFFTFSRDCFRLCRSFGDHSEKDISILKQGSKLSLKTKRYEQKLWAGFTLTLRSPSHKATNLWDLLSSQGSYQIYLSSIPFQPLMSKIHIFSCWIKD